MTKEQTQFITYIRTLITFGERFMGDGNKGPKPVHIPSGTIEEMFFETGRRQRIQELVEAGELQVFRKPLRNGHQKYYYMVTKPGAVDYSLLPKRPVPKDTFTYTMIKHLRNTILPDGIQATPYWQAFTKWRGTRIDLFVTVDAFGYRFHSPVTSLHKTIRPMLMLYGKQTASLDIICSQPTILAHLLKTAIGDNQFSGWIESGEDVYETLQIKAGLGNREEAKKSFFEIAFGKPSAKLADVYGNTSWVEWINALKKLPLSANRNTKYNWDGSLSYHNNLAMLLQRTESVIMRKVWAALIDKNIPFLTVHDEVIVRQTDLDLAKVVMADVLKSELPYARISAKLPVQSLITPSIGRPLTENDRILYDGLNTCYTKIPLGMPVIVSGIEVSCLKRTISETWEGYCLSMGRSNNEIWRQHIKNLLYTIGTIK